MLNNYLHNLGPSKKSTTDARGVGPVVAVAGCRVWERRSTGPPERLAEGEGVDLQTAFLLAGVLITSTSQSTSNPAQTVQC